MTLKEEKIQDDPIRGTPEIGRRGHLLHRLPACLRAGQVSGMVLTVPKVRLSKMPRLHHEHRKRVHHGTMTLKDEGRSGTLDGYYWVRDVQSGPPLGPSRNKGSEAGCRLSSSSRRSKCPPPRFVQGCRSAGRRRSVPDGDSRRVGVAESPRSTRARRGSVDVSVVMFGGPFRWQTAVDAVTDVRSERVVA
jgi:hypothetical protein